MKENIFIGVDGGGSTCKVRIEDAQGNRLGQSVGGPANIRFSVEKAWHTIYEAIDDILKPKNISLHDPQLQFHAGVGLAGCEVQEDREKFVNQSHPFKTLRLASDAHTACLAAHHGKDGAIIIVGTGVVGYQIHGGTISKVGGGGFPHDDEGGGAWLGLEAVRLTFQSLDLRFEKTPLLKDIFAKFNDDLNEFTTWSVRAKSTEFATIAPLVIKHAQHGEPVAVDLMQKAGDAITKFGRALDKMHNQQPSLACSLFGGVAPFIEPYLADDVRARLVPHEEDACYGAILMVKQAMGTA